MTDKVTSLDAYRAAREAANGDAMFMTLSGQSAEVAVDLMAAGDQRAIGLLSPPPFDHAGRLVVGWMLSAADARELAALLLVGADKLDGAA